MNIEKIDGVLVARLGERYDAFTEDLLEDAQRDLLAAVDPEENPHLVLDFSKTNYFSSSFLEVLFRVWNRIRKSPGASFSLAALQPFCLEIIHAARLNTLWPIHPTVEAAVEAASKR